MPQLVIDAGLRFRLVVTRALSRLGFSEYAFLVPMAVLIGVVSAGAAVAFHELIHGIRTLLYEKAFGPEFLYGRGLAVLVLLPALGGLAVGAFSTYVMRAREGHGIIDVMETVLRSRGRIRPVIAVEKILTAAATIGTGGSAGAEGPIVQIGAAISSGAGSLFQVNPSQLPILIGCGTAAGISAIFSSPMGGVLFTLEVILLDFSVRAFTPIVSASVVAYVTTQAIFRTIDPHNSHAAIFAATQGLGAAPTMLDWPGIPGMVVLGLVCGAAGVALTRLMYLSEDLFHRLPVGRPVRPALGGAAVGIMGVAYVMIFGWLLLRRDKPFAFHQYPMPAFFGDGYGVVQELLGTALYQDFHAGHLALLLLFLCFAKVIATCLTLSSGGSGGIIAPSLFVGAVAGALVGMALKALRPYGHIDPGFYALIGMGAVLAAVVHAPLASILILSEVTEQRNVVLPAMLACVVATGSAKVMFKDSVYTLNLRRRGLRPGGGGTVNLLHRLTVEQVELEPVLAFLADAPLTKLLEGTEQRGVTDVIVLDSTGQYIGMVTAEDVNTALVQREAIPLLLVGEMLRPELPCVKSTDDLASVLEAFSRHEVSRLPVSLAANPRRVIGFISRRTLMRRYSQALA